MVERKDGKELYPFLKKRCPNCSGANVEIIIKSKTFIKTETGREELDFDNPKIQAPSIYFPDNSGKIYNKIDEFVENKFRIIALGHPRDIPYENLDYWEYDELYPNEIYLYLNKAIVLYRKEKIELEDL